MVMNGETLMSTELQQHNTAMEVVVHTPSGDVKLNPTIVRKFLVNGSGAVTDQEIAMFLGLCKYQSLNPFLREAYLIKYGSQPATIVTAKETFLKRARQAQDFQGHKAGIVVMDAETREIKYTEGFCPPGSKIVGGWAEVYIHGWSFPLRVEVAYDEYVGRKGDGTINRMWSEKPATMIRKVALVQALREAFPSAFGAMYSEEEIPTPDELPKAPVDASEVIDVASPANPEGSAPVSSESSSSPQQASPVEHRRRRNKFRVDPLIFGADEIVTCGCTVEQLTELHALAKRSPEIKKWISGRVKAVTGYDQWSFMREDEAKSVLGAVRTVFPEARPEAGNDANGSPSDPNSENDTNTPPMPEDLVDCPVREGDRVSVSAFCLTNCSDRKSMGWCPAVPDDEPPAVAEEGMGL